MISVFRFYSLFTRFCTVTLHKRMDHRRRCGPSLGTRKMVQCSVDELYCTEGGRGGRIYSYARLFIGRRIFALWDVYNTDVHTCIIAVLFWHRDAYDLALVCQPVGCVI